MHQLPVDTKHYLRPCLHGVGDPGLMGLVSFTLGDTKQKKPTPLDRGPPLHVNRVLKDARLEAFLIRLENKTFKA